MFLQRFDQQDQSSIFQNPSFRSSFMFILLDEGMHLVSPPRDTLLLRDCPTEGFIFRFEAHRRETRAQGIRCRESYSTAVPDSVIYDTRRES